MSSLHGTVKSGPSQGSNMYESNIATGSEHSSLSDTVESVLGQSSTVGSSSSVSAGSGESESSSSESSDGTVNTKTRKMFSPSSPSSPSSKRIKLSDSSANKEESETTVSVASFASDRGERGDDTDSEHPSDTEAEELLRVESEGPEIEIQTLELNTKVPKRTPLPNSRAKRLPSPAASSKAPSPKPRHAVKRGSKWSAEEDALLMRLKKEDKSWDDTSARLPGRTATACKRHYSQSHAPSRTASKTVSIPAKSSRKPKISTAAPRKGRWSEEEVDELRTLKQADVQWAEILKQLPGRTLAACRRKWETLSKEAGASSTKPEAKITQNERKGSAKEGDLERSSDDELFENDMEEEKPKRDIVEENYSSSSDEEMSESDVDDQEPESKIKEEDPESVLEGKKAEGVGDEDTSDTSSEEDPFDSESEDEAEKKRHHATFFLKR